MTYAQIEAFLSIVQSGSLTKASESLFITQPTLSHRIQMLESELGIQLISRKKGVRKAELSEAGRIFVPVAEKWKKLWSETYAIADTERTETLSIAAVNSISAYIMPEVYRRFMERRLEVSLNFCTLHSSEAYRQVESSEVDMAFIANPMFSQRVATTPVFKEKMLLICASDSNLSSTVEPSQLDTEYEILLDWSREFVLWHEYWFGAKARPRVYTDNMQLLERFVARNGSWAIVPISAANVIAAYSGIRICEITDAPPDRVTYMLTRQSTFRGNTSAIIEDLQVVLREYDGIEMF